MFVAKLSKLKGLFLIVGALLILSVFAAACGEEKAKPIIKFS
ncbi:uncharacterized protein METZ01_LOCUS214848, partial [marine metagenome]